jgi:hypothetical protein
MADTNFIDGTTIIDADWLNDLNVFYYNTFDGATTKEEANTAIGATQTAIEVSYDNSFSGLPATELQTAIDSVNTIVEDLTASEVENVPLGNIASTNVQAAINELDSDKANNTVEILSANTETLTVSSPTLSSDVTISTRTNASNALCQLDGLGVIPISLLPTTQNTFKGFWSPVVDGSTPPATGNSNDYYVFSEPGDMDLLDAIVNTQQTFSVETNDRMVYLDGTTGDPIGWYYLATASSGTISASAVLFTDTNSRLAAAEAQKALEDLSNDYARLDGDTFTSTVLFDDGVLATPGISWALATGTGIFRNSTTGAQHFVVNGANIARVDETEGLQVWDGSAADWHTVQDESEIDVKNSLAESTFRHIPNATKENSTTTIEGSVTSSEFVGPLTGNADTATNATNAGTANNDTNLGGSPASDYAKLASPTFTGTVTAAAIINTSDGGYLYHDNPAESSGKIIITTSTPTGTAGSAGDVWFVV